MEKEIFCAGCGCLINEGDEIEINGDYYCADCIDANWRKCDGCGEWVCTDDAVECDGDTLCADCVERYAEWCDHCEEYHYHDGFCNVYDSEEYHHMNCERWCSECVETDAYRCDDCGEYFDDRLTIIHGDHAICARCMEDYYYCDHCGEYVYYTDWDSDCDRCCRCMAEYTGIDAYHNAPPIKYMGACRRVWRGLWRGIGVELEIDRKHEDPDKERDTVYTLREIAGDAIYFNRDGSLNHGFEIITQPHTEDAFWCINWEKILTVCRDNGYLSHDTATCGLHLHLSREMFGVDRMRQGVAVSKLICFYDYFYSDILKVSRRTADAADKWAAKYDITCRADAENIGKRKDCRGRYFAVNNSNRNTVEIRITRGTLNYNTFAACIDFMLTVAKNSRRIPWRNVRNACEWLKGLKPSTVEYLKKRNAFVGVV